LTESWQIDLPHIPFTFEFDPRLELDSLLAHPDEPRGEAQRRAIRLETGHPAEGAPSKFLPLDEEMMIRNPPCIVITIPLTCDLAHRATLQLEGIAESFRAGHILLGGQGSIRQERAEAESVSVEFPIGPVQPIPQGLIDRPGPKRMRIVLSPDPDLGWTDPDVRSIWPGHIESNWVEVEIVRR
jgi:hypothetical protein